MTQTPSTTAAEQLASESVTLLLSYHLARVDGRSVMPALAHTARVIRDRTKDPKLAALMRYYMSPLPTRPVNNKRMTGAQQKILSLNNLQADMKARGWLEYQL